MALDLVSAPLPAEAPPMKRRRLGWDDPGPALFAEAARLQLQIAAQLLTVHPALTNAQNTQAKGMGELPYAHDAQKKGSFADTHPHQSSTARAPSPPWQEDDKDGHYNFDLGDSLTPRYKILRKIGEGTFGRVLECWDRDAQELVAIKVIRSAEKYREAAMIEVDVLCTLGEKDRTGTRGCVQIRRWFDYRNHICIVFEKLGPSLFDFLRTNDYRPFPVDLVREFGQQLLKSVAYMHGLSLIHTDLKPENVLLVSPEYTKVVDRKNTTKHSLQMKRVPKSSRIKLIDFGSTTIDRECNLSVVSTRHYRAPEVILGSGWSYPCDIWSVGCILVELCSGEVLFQTHENLEHLAMMERVLGPIPSHIIRRSTGRAHKYFRHERRLNWPDRATSRESIRAVHRLSRLRVGPLILPSVYVPVCNYGRFQLCMLIMEFCLQDLVLEHADHSVGTLVDLLEQMLKYDPSDRPTAKEALEHSFFQGSQGDGL